MKLESGPEWEGLCLSVVKCEIFVTLFHLINCVSNTLLMFFFLTGCFR